MERILPYVLVKTIPPFLTLPHPNSSLPSASWQLFVLVQAGCVLFGLPVCG